MHYRDALRKLAVRDDVFVESILTHDLLVEETPLLEEKTRALINLGALIALDAPTPSYQWAVDVALAHGATPAEIVDVLVSLLPTAGVPRVTAAAPRLALALGYDTDVALEEFNRLAESNVSPYADDGSVTSNMNTDAEKSERKGG